jgi:O-antigen biosynthesis protein WbqV
MQTRLQTRILRSLAILHDVSSAAVAFLLAQYLVRGRSGLMLLDNLLEQTLGFMLIAVVCMFASGLNRGSWRYASLPDLLGIVRAATWTCLIFTIVAFMLTRGSSISRLAIPLTWVLMIFLLGGGRLIYRILSESAPFRAFRERKVARKYVLLYPYNDTTEAYIRMVRRIKTDAPWISGIIDEKPLYRARELQGKRVLGSIADIGEIATASRQRGQPVSELIVTDPQVTGERISALLQACNDAAINITRLPDATGRAERDNGAALTPNPLRIEDLLGRAENQIDPGSISKLINNRPVLVSGAGGSIGSELCRQIAAFGPSELVLAEQSEHNLYLIEKELVAAFPDITIVPRIVDVRDGQRVDSLMREHKPDVVFHAAALKHVPMVEENPIEAVKTNVLGTATLASASIVHKVKVFVLISTDKAVNPANVMGATKRAAEAFCQSLDLSESSTHFVAVRFGNVLGSSGSVVPLFRKQIETGGPITVTHPDITRFFMTIPEAVRLVLQASSHGLKRDSYRGKILVLDMGEPVRIVDLARRMIQLAGLRPDIDIQIKITGLRPGEKLYEELHGEEEDSESPDGGGFTVVSPRIIDSAVLSRSIDGLSRACASEDLNTTLQLLRHIVPSYTPAANSRNLGRDRRDGEHPQPDLL